MSRSSITSCGLHALYITSGDGYGLMANIVVWVEGQDLPCTYLAQHELESINVIIIVVIIIIIIIIIVIITIIIIIVIVVDVWVQRKLWKSETSAYARAMCISQVLGTDMKKHFDITSRFQVEQRMNHVSCSYYACICLTRVSLPSVLQHMLCACVLHSWLQCHLNAMLSILLCSQCASAFDL